MDDIRWFAPNEYARLILPELRNRGLIVATDGHRAVKLAVAMSGSVAREAVRYASSHRVPMVQYVWDLMPGWIGEGRWDPMWSIRGLLFRLARMGRRYRRRRGYLSTLRFAVAHSAAVWAPSTFVRQLVAEHFGVLCAEMPYCYDSNLFAYHSTRSSTERAPLDGNGAILLSVSRMESYKNHSSVIRAAAAFDPPRPVRLIGHGPERASLARLATSLGVALTISAHVSADELIRAYQAAGVVACPSTFEGMGLTPIEAAACGARVVASDIPPHREFLGDRVEFFPPMDQDALVAAIRRSESGASRPGPFPRVTIEQAGARFYQALVPLVDR
jgi:glycosyltransferase involved in cell wall biosynthesis